MAPEASKPSRGACANRTKLGLKELSSLLGSGIWTRANRTKLGLKVDSARAASSGLASANRTKLGLKGFCWEQVAHDGHNAPIEPSWD